MIAVKVLALLVLMAVNSEGLKCIPCDPTRCVAPEGCQGGLTLDICKCCQRCAKLLGEDCGRAWNMSGICDEGLVCDEPSGEYSNVPGKCVAKSLPCACG